MGMEAFAHRAERELLRTGERVRKRVVETRGDLTAQEAQIARLARDGFSNPEIAARLFISPRTVEHHLHKVFSKLNISSRKRTRPRATARADGCAGCLRVAQLLDAHRRSASTRTSLPRPSIRAIA